MQRNQRDPELLRGVDRLINRGFEVNLGETYSQAIKGKLSFTRYAEPSVSELLELEKMTTGIENGTEHRERESN